MSQDKQGKDHEYRNAQKKKYCFSFPFIHNIMKPHKEVILASYI